MDLQQPAMLNTPVLQLLHRISISQADKALARQQCFIVDRRLRPLHSPYMADRSVLAAAHQAQRLLAVAWHIRAVKTHSKHSSPCGCGGSVTGVLAWCFNPLAAIQI